MTEELRERLRQHFTKGELVEFLPLTMTDLIEKLDDEIMDNYADIVSELCFEFEVEGDEE